jgi:retron-type reverse transcriptase
VGGNANNGSNAGLVYVNTNNGASNTNTNVGSQLCCQRILGDQTLPLGKKQQVIQSGAGNVKVKALPRTAQFKKMKRIGNLFEEICSVENLEKADALARRGKRYSYGVILHDRTREENIEKLHLMLLNKEFKTSPYDNFFLNCDNGKIREISRLPYFPDRIVHHAVMNILEPIWYKIFTEDTFSCIKGRGIHRAADKVKQCLKTDLEGTQYCLKLDIKKFYPSVKHEVLKSIIRRKIKDKDLLWLLDEIIDSASGVPIGNYLSQYFANLYMAYFDHYIKEVERVKYYFRYCDDMVILGDNKEKLHGLRLRIDRYIREELKIEIKGNWQVFPVDIRGIDFLGYRFYHTHTLLRKSIKKRFAMKMAKLKGEGQTRSYSAYWGWAKHCDSKNLIRTLNENVCRIRN